MTGECTCHFNDVGHLVQCPVARRNYNTGLGDYADHIVSAVRRLDAEERAVRLAAGVPSYESLRDDLALGAPFAKSVYDALLPYCRPQAEQVQAASAPSDAEIEGAFRNRHSARGEQISVGRWELRWDEWRDAVAWLLNYQRAQPATPDMRSDEAIRAAGMAKYGADRYERYLRNQQPAAVAEPVLDCEEEFEKFWDGWKAEHPSHTHPTAGSTWKACWDLLRPQPPEPADPCRTGYERYFNEGGDTVGYELWEAGWQAAKEEKS